MGGGLMQLVALSFRAQQSGAIMVSHIPLWENTVKCDYHINSY